MTAQKAKAICVGFTQLFIVFFLNCTVPEHIILPPKTGLKFPGAWGVLKDQYM